MALAIFEGIADHALHAFARVDVFLNRDLIRRALLEYAPGIDVNAFGVFAHHDEIDVPGLNSFQRAQRRIQKRTGRTLAYRSIRKRMPSRISWA